ncbi:MAG: hypothetical protein KAQ83_02755 [Nanoarchaeota archaeon]|nr:hypothetical protein [Nanoarchaeota archaeon]
MKIIHQVHYFMLVDILDVDTEELGAIRIEVLSTPDCLKGGIEDSLEIGTQIDLEIMGSSNSKNYRAFTNQININ